MNSYFLRRLFPFYVFAIIIELVFTIYSVSASPEPLDLSLLALIKTVGILLLTTTCAFLFIMLPYVLYLVLLPQKSQNTKLDKIISIIFYTIFIVGTYVEEIISSIFWRDNELPASLIAFRHSFKDVNALLNNSFSSPSSLWVVLGILGLSFVTIFYTKKYLFTTITSPRLLNRIFQSAIFGFICILTYMNINPDALYVSSNHYNNELAREGSYELLKDVVDTYKTDSSRDFQ